MAERFLVPWLLLALQVSQQLQQLYKQYGYFVYRASYFIADRPEKSRAVFDRLCAGGNYPKVRQERCADMLDGNLLLRLREPGSQSVSHMTAAAAAAAALIARCQRGGRECEGPWLWCGHCRGGWQGEAALAEG